eukprot:302439-Rhodomonas_salina.1
MPGTDVVCGPTTVIAQLAIGSLPPAGTKPYRPTRVLRDPRGYGATPSIRDLWSAICGTELGYGATLPVRSVRS